MIPWLSNELAFPPVTAALREPNGLLAAGGTLTADRLEYAYRRGIFPWYGEGEPILWWTPDPRMVLLPDEFKVSRSLAKTLQQHQYEVRTDTCFREVMINCAAPRRTQSGTWIDDNIIAAYCELHHRGLAHSIETWMDGELVGGLYGVALGRVFYGESMFSLRRDASKIALTHLIRQLTRWQFGVIDCQVYSDHLASLGAREIDRADFLLKLEELVNCPGILGHWNFDHDLA